MSKEKPDSPGFYWFKGRVQKFYGEWEDIGPVIVEMYELSGELELAYCGSEEGFPLSKVVGEWIGPLEVPKELSE